MSKSGIRHKTIVAFIPARGGSKAVHLKNIARIGGQPLIYWTAKACSESRRVKQVVVATEDENIERCVESLKIDHVKVISRSPESATDTASTEMALLEFAVDHSFDYVVLVQPTSPLLIAQHVDGALELLFSSGADSVLSVVRTKRFFWKEKMGFVHPENYKPSRRPRRQDWSGQLVENGALYITSRKRLMSSRCRISGKVAAYEMPPESYFELDSPLDWMIIDPLLRGFRSSHYGVAHAIKTIKLFCVDVDGTLTDGGMYYTAGGELMKRFDTRDATGMRLVEKKGIALGIVSSENSPIVLSRAGKLEIKETHVGIKDKEVFFEELLGRLDLTWKNLAYVGDDVNDLGVIRRAGFSACPADAVPEVLRQSVYVCERPGGRGAVREVCELILRVLKRA